MRSSFNPKATCWLPNWQVCLSVLLILLVVYNPFAALSGHSSSISYDKLARNRSTIGSSELQHFSPVSNTGLHSDVEIALLATEQLRYEPETQPRADHTDEIPSEPTQLTGFWFRPPPSQ